MKFRVYVNLKPSVLDPQGEAVNNALKKNGYGFVESVRVGKFFDIEVKQTENLEEKIKEFSHKLLANPIIESFSIEKGQ